MEITLRYVTLFRYRAPVWDSHNALRACPRTDEHQATLTYHLEIAPAARIQTYQDRWGTRVDTFGIRASHDELLVDARAEVTTSPRPTPGPSDAAALADDGFRSEHWLFLHPTAHTRWTPAMAAEAQEVVAGIDDTTARVSSIMDFVHGSMAYVPGATTIGVDPSEVWEARKGVCQDYAHLAIALLRSVGIPSRYVSGYFYAADPSVGSSPDGAEIVVQTHAWVEAAIPGFGWWACDPTNGLEAGERHVTIGHGRDYDDVTPLRGVYHGDTNHELAVEVTMGLDSVDWQRLPSLGPASPEQ